MRRSTPPHLTAYSGQDPDPTPLFVPCCAALCCAVRKDRCSLNNNRHEALLPSTLPFMARPLYWLGEQFFYAIGNTSAVSLARDVTPDQDISLLLLGCGDPRSVLFTLFSEHETATRKLDFTCVDYEPAILARNVLLLSMVIDNRDAENIFDIFFHLYLEKESLALLVSQCRILLDASMTLEGWKKSRYGSTLRMSSQHTLIEIRRHWDQYTKMHALPNTQLCTIVEAFKAAATEYQKQYHDSQESMICHTSRSAGPLMMYATEILSDCFYDFWKYGTTFISPARRSAANLLNPTFVYTQLGVGCHVHYGSDLVMPFHLAPIFGNLDTVPTRLDIMNGIRTQFREWCSAFRRYHQRGLCIVRVFFADAILGARALQFRKETGGVQTRILVCHWRAETITLDEEEYKQAPLAFDVVDTSNLDDYIGLLNVLTISIPLLSGSGNGVLYLESLLIQGHADNAPKDLTKRFHADLTVMTVLFHLCPVDFVTGYSTRSNIHELLAYNFFPANGPRRQYHQVTAWKPLRSDPPVVDSRQLGTFLYELYHALFEEEDSLTFQQRHPNDFLNALISRNRVPYSRESFVLLLKFIRGRLQIPRDQWVAVLDRFFDLQSSDSSMKMDTINFHDLCAQLHFHGVHSMDVYRWDYLASVGVFRAWAKVPPLVRVFLTVPRQKLGVLAGATPVLQAGMRGPKMHNLFSSVHAAFGVLSVMGTPANPKVSFEEDPKRFHGTKPLVISFVMPAMLLTGDGPGYDLPSSILITFAINNNTANTVHYAGKLGLHLEIHSAALFDSNSVLVLPAEQPLPFAFSANINVTSTSGQIGSRGPISANFNEDCDLVESFSAKITVEDGLARAALQSAEAVAVRQLSHNIIQLMLGGRTQEVSFPFPIVGAQHRLRLARKSLWIEVSEIHPLSFLRIDICIQIIVPLRSSFTQGGVDINPFPIALDGLVPWSVHRVNLERLPVLNLKSSKLDQWLNVHVTAAFSEREARARKDKGTDTMMFVKDTIHSIIVQASGIQPKGSSPHRIFTLLDKETNNCDTVFLVDQLRFDLSAHTIVCDAFVLPLSDERMMEMIMIDEQNLAKLLSQAGQIPVEPGEVKSWKQLLPALVERCRTWKHRDSCQYASEGRVPLTTEMEVIPLCACGEGQDVQRMHDVPLWKPFAKYCTRIALSPLFAVSYVENVGRKDRSCCVCRAKAPFTCPKCKKDRYCSTVCRKKDWDRHRERHHNFWEK
ncbi:MYND-type domain-containing protein [Mycena sanguinolenta]|uniref:MYND-type domain-containing protein n=1 Tax=Mycena sanguinolenta TaxID=230812 RepID=A0A8H7D699_9AGAR|nr:MYND-type domain-containing protein [Mycena sanguinolenta]